MGILEIILEKTGKAYAQMGKTRRELEKYLDMKQANEKQRKIALDAYDGERK